MGESNEFKVTLIGPGINVERSLSEEVAFNVLAAILGKPVTLAGKQAIDPVGGEKSDRPVSLREFMSGVSPSTHIEKIATIGSYLHDYKGASSFSKSDIEEGYRSAREQMPGNLSRDISKAVVAGWLDDAGERGQFHVTNSGAKAVQSKFSN